MLDHSYSDWKKLYYFTKATILRVSGLEKMLTDTDVEARGKKPADAKG